jgi:hypothetical protein
VEADDDWENVVERTRDTGCVSLVLELDVRRSNSQGETRRPFMPLGSPSDLLVPEPKRVLSGVGSLSQVA